MGELRNLPSPLLHPQTPSSFLGLFGLTARTLGSIATHTHTHTRMMQQWRVWSPSCTNDDVREQSQTHRPAWLLQSLSLPSTGHPLSSVLTLIFTFSFSSSFPSLLLPHCTFSFLRLLLPSLLMHQDTNEVGLCQANMTPHPNQP